MTYQTYSTYYQQQSNLDESGLIAKYIEKFKNTLENPKVNILLLVSWISLLALTIGLLFGMVLPKVVHKNHFIKFESCKVVQAKTFCYSHQSCIDKGISCNMCDKSRYDVVICPVPEEYYQDNQELWDDFCDYTSNYVVYQSFKDKDSANQACQEIETEDITCYEDVRSNHLDGGDDYSIYDDNDYSGFQIYIPDPKGSIIALCLIGSSFVIFVLLWGYGKSRHIVYEI